MLYTQKTFTCPTASKSLKQKEWDRIFLKDKEFLAKYGHLKK